MTSSSLDYSELLERFINPPDEYCPVPTWWWEADELDLERLEWEMQLLKEQGIKQVMFFYYDPTSSKPPYASEPWWKIFKQVCETAKRLDMKIWFYDHPGCGGPEHKAHKIVTVDSPEYSAWTIHKVERDVGGPCTIDLADWRAYKPFAAMAYKIEDGRLTSENAHDLTSLLEGGLTWEVPSGRWKVMIFSARSADDFTYFWHYVDLTRRDVATKLLEDTFYMYERRVRDYLGSVIGGSFQDELTSFRFPPYSLSLIEEFKRRKGYDLVPRITALYYDVGDETEKVRCDLFDVITTAHEDYYFKPLYQWHEKYGMAAAHDQMGRGSIIGGTLAYGDYFRTQRWYQVPGYDDAPGCGMALPLNFRDAKLSSSIAHLYERPRVWVEALHSSGWGATILENVSMINQEYIWGANLYDVHGLYYSLHGGWWEWAPPCMHFHQPYWQHYRVFADYASRLSCMQSQGKHVCDVAILYPVTGVQAGLTADGNPNEDARLTEDYFWKLSKEVFEEKIDFDWIDYESIERSEVIDGRLQVAGESFRVLIIPPISTIKKETLRKAVELFETGGMVICLRMLPYASCEEGRKDPELHDLLRKLLGESSPRAASEEPLERRSEKGGRAVYIHDEIRLIPGVIKEYSLADFYSEEKALEFCHRRVGEADFYLLFNNSDKSISAKARFRCTGTLEVWDPLSGKVRPLHCFRKDETATEADLTFNSYQAYYVVFRPTQPVTVVTESNLDGVEGLSESDEELKVLGWVAKPGVKKVRLRHKGCDYKGEVSVERVPPELVLNDWWKFQLEPTMDNRWGDYRLPSGNEMLGAECRQFRHREEADGEDGEKLGWHQNAFDDSDWEKATYTVGPYWWVIGPFDTKWADYPHYYGFNAVLPPEASVDLNATYVSEGRKLKWRKYCFSQRFGIEKDVVHMKTLGPKMKVPDEFLDLGYGAPGDVWYAFTNVYSPEDREVEIKMNVNVVKKVWMNGEQIFPHRTRHRRLNSTWTKIRAGWNAILLKLSGSRLRAYLHIAYNDERKGSVEERKEKEIPSLRWFREPSPLVYDVSPDKTKRVGWYRFAIPPGAEEMTFSVKGKTKAYVNGTEVPVSVEGIVKLGGIALREGVNCALRIEQEPGAYAGAAFMEPVFFKMGEGEVTLGCWTKKGLLSYSGAAVYTKIITLSKEYLENDLFLDLGDVAATAEVWVNDKHAGVRAWKPYRFNVTGLLRAGENVLRVKVCNTLANHYLVGLPSLYVTDGSEVSGLLGPVRIMPHRRVQITACPDT